MIYHGPIVGGPRHGLRAYADDPRWLATVVTDSDVIAVPYRWDDVRRCWLPEGEALAEEITTLREALRDLRTILDAETAILATTGDTAAAWSRLTQAVHGVIERATNPDGSDAVLTVETA